MPKERLEKHPWVQEAFRHVDEALCEAQARTLKSLLVSRLREVEEIPELLGKRMKALPVHLTVIALEKAISDHLTATDQGTEWLDVPERISPTSGELEEEVSA